MSAQPEKQPSTAAPPAASIPAPTASTAISPVTAPAVEHDAAARTARPELPFVTRLVGRFGAGRGGGGGAGNSDPSGTQEPSPGHHAQSS